MLSLCALIFAAGFGLVFIGNEKYGIISFIFAMVPLGIFLSALSIYFFRKNIVMFRENNTSIGMNRFGSNTRDEGKGQYIFNQILAAIYTIMGLALILGSLGLGIWAILYK